MAVVIGGRETAISFARAAVQARALSRQCVASNGRKMLAGVLSRAPQRTGRYKSTIKLRVILTPGGARAEVYSDHPAAWRLERGFHSTDSRGRTYHQAGRPHFAPGAAGASDNFYRELLAIVYTL